MISIPILDKELPYSFSLQLLRFFVGIASVIDGIIAISTLGFVQSSYSYHTSLYFTYRYMKARNKRRKK